MASYRPFLPPPPPQPPQSTYAPPPPPLPNHNSVPPPPPQPNQYSQNWGYPSGYAPPPPSNNNVGQTNQFSSYPPPLPPPPESAYPPPPPPPVPAPPGQMYFPSSQFLPPPPVSPPRSSVPPPPPPPTQSPPPPPPPSNVLIDSKEKERRHDGYTRASNDVESSKRRDRGHAGPSRQHPKSSALPPVPRKPNGGPSGRVETEDERRARKKREMEKQRQEEKQRQQLKESQTKLLQKSQLSSGVKPHGSVSGSQMGDRRGTSFLSGDRMENRLKKPTTFICKLKFRDELPDPTSQPKLLSIRRDKDRAARYAVTSLEKVHKPQLHVEPDLGIPLDLLDLSVYNTPKDEILHIDPEDERLLQEDVTLTPIKNDGLKRKERPTDKGMSWLVKTQYISPLSTDATRQSTEKQAKELREKRGNALLDNLNSREKKIKDIRASFEACKSHPVHATNKKLQPVEILPLFPDFERWDDQFVVATFDGPPTVDSESYNKMEKSVRDAHESQAVMKSFVASTLDPAKPDKFLAYMVPSVGELSKDIYDGSEDISYTWVREYHWDVRGEDADDPTNFLVSFDESEARYMPLPTKLMLRKKRAREGKTSDEVEHFPVPASITVRQRSHVSVEMKDSEGYVSSKGRNSNPRHHGRMDMEDDVNRHDSGMEDDGDMDQSSGAEYMSD